MRLELLPHLNTNIWYLVGTCTWTKWLGSQRCNSKAPRPAQGPCPLPEQNVVCFFGACFMTKQTKIDGYCIC